MGYTKTLFAYCAILLYYTPPPKKSHTLSRRMSTFVNGDPASLGAIRDS